MAETGAMDKVTGHRTSGDPTVGDPAVGDPAVGNTATEEPTTATGTSAAAQVPGASAAVDPAGDANATNGDLPDAALDTALDAEGGAVDRPKRGRPRKATAKPKGIELVLTVTGTAEGTDWRADVSHGSKRVVKDLAIPASAVAAAAKDLHPEVAEAIEEVLSTAREQQRSRVEQLQAELEAARRALADLED